MAKPEYETIDNRKYIRDSNGKLRDWRYPYEPIKLEPHAMNWRTLVEEFLWIERTSFDGPEMEVTGLVKWEPSKIPLGDREILAALFSRFLRLVQVLEQEKIPMVKMPQIVIGDVSGLYKAQVTLVIRV